MADEPVARPRGTSFLSEIRASLPALPPGQAAVAKAALADPLGVSQLAITSLAELTNTSPATVSRFCRDIGLDSYAQLRLHLAAAAQQLHEQARGAGITGDIARNDSLADATAKVAHADARTVADTANQLGIDELAAVVGHIARAREVLAFGLGSSGVIASYLQGKLRSLGIPAIAFSDGHGALMSAAQSGPRHVVIAISHTGATADAVGVLNQARDRGATTVAITANPRSGLAATADLTLSTVASETSFRTGALRSRVADMVVVDCICVGVALRRYDASVAALSRVESVLPHRP